MRVCHSRRPPRPLRLPILLAVVLAGLSADTTRVAAAVDDAPQRTELDFFESRIRPVLIEHCYKCHAADAAHIRGGLLVDSREGIRTGGDSGPAVVPGKPEESLLLSAIRHESWEMPPDQRLSDRVVEDFETWIRNGAADPRTGGTVHRETPPNPESGRDFWSFQPVHRPPVPEAGTGWAANDIDRFVAARHADHGVQPAHDLGAQQLLRRLSFVLTGLPPTPDQLSAFVAACESDRQRAVAETVNRLLASPHFGERWGRHWLDVTRFAESSGGGRSLMFPDAWRFRDYIIDAFNEDRPYDQLIREHLAGDLLPANTQELRDQQVTGSGYLVLGPINYEEQDKELLRMNVVDEQIDSMGRTFLGMTLGCARCHDHKFDPIPTKDYYALAGIFRSTKTLTPGNVSGYVTTALRSHVDPQAMAAWSETEAELKTRISSLRSRLGDSVANPQKPIAADDLPGLIVDDDDATYTGEWETSNYLRPFVGGGYRHSGKQKTGRTATYSATLPAAGRYAVRMSYNWQNSRTADVPVTVHHADGQSVTHVNQQQAATVDGVFVELGRFRFDAGQPAVVVIDAEHSTAGYVIVDAVQFVPVAETDDTAEAAARARKTAALRTELAELQARLKTHRDAQPKAPVAMSVTDVEQPADWHVHIRGEIRNRGDLVPRGFLSVTAPPDAPPDWSIPADSSGRRELAEWIASESHPLTARVYVNRVWQYAVGEGLVRTPDNFGSTGRPPTHPELLDYLAYTFMHEDNWSTKSLIRRICLSRTFQMASHHGDPAVLEHDPDNTWLARGFRRPLDAEALRDAILFVSGELDLTRKGGRTIDRLTTYDNSYDHAAHSITARSVYVPCFRNAMLDLFSVFNAANPNLVTGRRTRSVLPSQALFLLNSPFVMDQAEHAARSLLESRSQDDGPNRLIREAWQRTLAREPSTEELRVIRTHLTSGSDDPIAAWTSVFHSLFASVDFRYLE